MRYLLATIVIVMSLIAAVTGAKADIQPPCNIGQELNGTTTLTLSGSTAIAQVQWSVCGETVSAVIRWSTGRVTNGTSDQLPLSPGQCVSITADISSNISGSWGSQSAGPVCAPTGGTGGSGGGGTPPPKDTDGDGVPDTLDNCPTVKNGPAQTDNQNDSDLNGIGDSCDGAWAVNSSTGDTVNYLNPLGTDSNRTSGTNGCFGVGLGKYAYGTATIRGGVKNYIIFGQRPIMFQAIANVHMCLQPLTNHILTVNSGDVNVQYQRSPWWSYDNNALWHYPALGSIPATAQAWVSFSVSGCYLGVGIGCRKVQIRITFDLAPPNFHSYASYTG